MDGPISREQAIRIICQAELSRLTAQERAEQLEIMLLEDWASHPLWPTVPADVRREFAELEEIADPRAGRYDPVLMLWLTGRYAGARNDFLVGRLRACGQEVTAISGGPTALVACPCCGYRTLGSRGHYDTCPVCWWEDDGQDNDDANRVLGGPNGELSLAQARVHFLTKGMSDPSRQDLRDAQEPREKYERGRVFELASGGRGVREPAAGWSCSLADEVR